MFSEGQMTETAKTAGHWNKMVGFRMEPKLRYLAELAADAKGFDTLTDYIKWALEESFKQVTLRVPPDPEPTYSSNGEVSIPEPPDVEEERVANDAMSIRNLADKLWSESEFGRIQALSILAPHRVSDVDRALLSYIHNRKDLQIPRSGGYKLNREKIDKEWNSVKVAFENARKGGKK
jgi:hypothetical protein